MLNVELGSPSGRGGTVAYHEADSWLHFVVTLLYSSSCIIPHPAISEASWRVTGLDAASAKAKI